MDKQTLILELIGLSRVVNADLRHLIYKRIALADLADRYEPVNPFDAELDVIEEQIDHSVKANIFRNLSAEERQAFISRWDGIQRHQQIAFLQNYVREGQ
jgi:hypothetical protein